MNFLYPQFLFGLITLSIPVIVHLFNFRKTKKIKFSNNLFLQHIKEVSTAKRKLKHYLTLAARLLFILFLVLAFAQPFIPGIKESLKNDLVYIYLDNSYSMSNEVATDLTSFDQGIGFIDELVDIYPQNTRFKLLTNEFLPGADLLKTKNEIKDLLSEIAFSGISRTMEEVNNRQLQDFLNDTQERKDIFWLSDFQRSTVGNWQRINFDTSAHCYLVPFEYRAPNNVYIDTIYLSNPFLLENEKNNLIISFKNAGNKSVEDLPVKLFINASQVANTTLAIPANGSVDQSFELNQSLERINKGKVTFEEFPVTFDNDFFFTLNVDDRVDVLEIRSDQASNNVEQVYANDKLFNFSSFPISNLDYNAIGNTDLIVLNEITAVSTSLAEALLEFLSKNGTIVIIPAQDTDVNTYSRILPVRQKVTATDLSKTALRTPDLSNPFFANMFIDSDEIFEMPLGSVKISTLAPGEAILSLKNREPFLSNVVGDKNIFLFSVPLKEAFTNFHQHAIFVPVMYRIASLSNVLSDDLYYSLNQPIITLRVDTVSKNVIYKLKNDDQELIPAQRILGRDIIMELPKNTMKIGYYDVFNNEGLKKILSFNYNSEESIMAQYSRSELNDIVGNNENVDIYSAEDNNDFTRSLRELHSGVPLWKYMLIVSLLALLAEILIIRYL
ncbi:BatA domain-containing protein [Fulvivirgaceae bacterium BMA12]|uniref:BatA domain-containing protein n=1 Tax=Agaribacillus aureus TaxID=3051825 RepID=A0ABT8LDJ8_9BACT|nr:BatA domain-containing protein [Fulvivirgaceae bacterium BMA12]